MLKRCDPRRLREDAGISRATVAAAIGGDRESVRRWEARDYGPAGPAGQRWARFTAALERRAAFDAYLVMIEAEEEAA